MTLRSKALDADYIRADIVNSSFPTIDMNAPLSHDGMLEFNSNWDLIMARIEPKEKRDFKRDLNAWKGKYSYKGKEKGDEKMIIDNTLNEILRDFQTQKTAKRMTEENNKRKEQENEVEKKYIEEQQIMNDHTLNWIVNNLIKDIKIDWTNKTVAVFWADGIKNYVHCMEGDEFNPEYGIMRCFFKRAFGNGNDLKRFFKKYIPEREIEDNSYELEELEKRLVIPKKKNGKRRGTRRGERKSE